MAFIYKITNKINQKSYIGETTTTLKKRWHDHIRESFSEGHGYNYHLHCAIRKYGLDNFTFEEIEQCSDEARFAREHYYIMFYNTLEPNGYNLLASGTGSVKVPIEAILESWNEGLSTVEIGKRLGLHRQTVATHLKANNISQEEIMKRQGERTSQRCAMPVLQYTLEGDFIREWPSATSVSKEGFSQSMVSNVCRKTQITAHNYLWKYKEDPRPISQWVDAAKNKKDSGKPKKSIYQLDNNKNIINEYNSAAEAARALGLSDKSNICAAARKGHRAYGYYWQYKN